MTPVVRNVQSLANCQNQQTHGHLGNYQLPPAKRCISILTGQRDFSDRGSSVASIIWGENTTLSSSLNNSRLADIPLCITSTCSATQRRSINTPTATLGTSSHSTSVARGTSQADSMHPVVSSPASYNASTPTPLSSLGNLPTAISNPVGHTIKTNPPWLRDSDTNQRHRQWQS